MRELMHAPHGSRARPGHRHGRPIRSAVWGWDLGGGTSTLHTVARMTAG